MADLVLLKGRHVLGDELGELHPVKVAAASAALQRLRTGNRDGFFLTDPAGGTALASYRRQRRASRIKEGRYEDTNRLFQPPDRFDIRVTAEGAPEYWAEKITAAVRPVYDPKRPTALFVGRFQPFHDGHKALIEEGLRRVGQVCIAVRDIAGIDESNPYPFSFVCSRIEDALREDRGRFVVIRVSNITAVFYGRDVGYVVERIELDPLREKLSASEIRRRIEGRP